MDFVRRNHIKLLGGGGGSRGSSLLLFDPAYLCTIRRAMGPPLLVKLNLPSDHSQ